MYTIFSLVLILGCGFLTLRGAMSRDWAELRRLRWVNLLLSGLAVLGTIAVPLLAKRNINAGQGGEEWTAWASDAFELYLGTTLPVCLILLGVMVAAALLALVPGKKDGTFSAVVRSTASVAASVIFLFLASFYAAMAETDPVPVHVYIMILGAAQALLYRIVALVELSVRLKNLSR